MKTDYGIINFMDHTPLNSNVMEFTWVAPDYGIMGKVFFDEKQNQYVFGYPADVVLSDPLKIAAREFLHQLNQMRKERFGIK